MTRFLRSSVSVRRDGSRLVGILLLVLSSSSAGRLHAGWPPSPARADIEAADQRRINSTMSPSAQAAAAWRRSSKCATSECVEIARDEQDMILLRDSKSPQAPPFRYTTAEFRAFLDGAKAGEFDDLV
jgi:Domain of unknown function (DUF397)